jgi:hypothetical protein
LGATVAGWPSTTRFEIDELPSPPRAVRPSVEPLALPVTASAVTSPPNSDTDCAWPEAVATACEPVSLVAEVAVAPVVATEPSAGYVKPSPKETRYGGAETRPACEAACPGTTTRIAYARAVAPAAEAGPPAPAEPAASRSTPPRIELRPSRLATVTALLTIPRPDGL